MGPGLIVIVAAILGFVAVAGVGLVFAGGSPSQTRTLKRAQAIGGSASVRDARARVRAAANPDARRKQIVNTLKEQERQQKKARLTIASKLLQAGLTFRARQFYIASAAFGVVVLFIAFLVRPVLWADLLLGLAAAAGPPRWILGFLGKRRLKKFTAAFSDGMDIIVRGIKSGLPVHECLGIIGRETPEPMAGEFRRLVENLAMGMPLDTALDKMSERVPTNELRFFAIVMNVQQRTGGNLAEALNNLSTVLRSRKLMREKIKALSSEATASAMIIGALPPSVVLLISITSPAYMVPMFADPRGQLMLIASGVWMALGIFVMRRMINFKF
ncbi:MAG TPA: type II secretion system F family protein [Caulobacteraceae bacterium]